MSRPFAPAPCEAPRPGVELRQPMHLADYVAMTLSYALIAALFTAIAFAMFVPLFVVLFASGLFVLSGQLRRRACQLT